MGADCFIQQHVDIDPSEGAKDHACGALTYDGHKGTDIRIRTLRDVVAGVAVLAAAEGTVRAVRDGETDRLVADDEGRRRVAGRECGNGVVIAHGEGWETQYCHMRKGSVAVTPGDTVRPGQVLGQIGYSGDAGFPHVHFEVRRNGRTVDPFSGREPDGACAAPGQGGLWDNAAADMLAYAPAQVLALDFAAGPVEMGELVAGTLPALTPTSEMQALVLYMWTINLLAGDAVRLSVTGPDGATIIERLTEPMPANRAQQMYFTGRKRPAGGWPLGIYTGRLEITRNGAPVRDLTRSIEIE